MSVGFSIAIGEVGGLPDLYTGERFREADGARGSCSGLSVQTLWCVRRGGMYASVEPSGLLAHRSSGCARLIFLPGDHGAKSLTLCLLSSKLSRTTQRKEPSREENKSISRTPLSKAGEAK